MMSSRTPRIGSRPGVMGMSWRPAHSIVSLLPVTGTHTGGCGCWLGEDLFGPGPPDDLPRFLEARARVAQWHLVDVVLARNAAGEAGDDAAAGQAVEHRQLLGQAERIVQRQQV